MEVKDLYQKIRKGFKQHIVDSTAILVIGTPISAGFETGLAGMSDDVSLNARFIATGLTFGGMGSIISKGRDIWRKGFNVNDETKEIIQQTYDAAYLTTINSILGPIFYYVSGSRDWEEITIGTGAAALLSLTMGGPAGYTIDAVRDLTGIKSSKRIPESISNLGSRSKKSLVALAIAGSLGITA